MRTYRAQYNAVMMDSVGKELGGSSVHHPAELVAIAIDHDWAVRIADALNRPLLALQIADALQPKPKAWEYDGETIAAWPCTCPPEGDDDSAD